MKTNKLLVIVVVLQGLMLLGQWTGNSVSIAKPANGEVTLPDPSTRQLAMLEELRSLNGKVDRLATLLSSGDVQVKIKADK